jgi:hypothetical protein
MTIFDGYSPIAVKRDAVTLALRNRLVRCLSHVLFNHTAFIYGKNPTAA